MTDKFIQRPQISHLGIQAQKMLAPMCACRVPSGTKAFSGSRQGKSPLLDEDCGRSRITDQFDIIQ